MKTDFSLTNFSGIDSIVATLGIDELKRTLSDDDNDYDNDYDYDDDNDLKFANFGHSHGHGHGQNKKMF